MSVPTPPARMIVKRTSRVIWCSSTALGSKRPNWSTGTATGKAGTASAIHTASAVLDQSHSATLPTALTAVPVDVGATAQTVESAVALQAQWQNLLAELAMLAEMLRGIVHAASIPAATPQDPTPPKPKRKYTPRKTDQKVDPVPLTERKWITIKQAAAIYPKSEQAYAEKARHFIAASPAHTAQRHP